MYGFVTQKRTHGQSGAQIGKGDRVLTAEEKDQEDAGDSGVACHDEANAGVETHSNDRSLVDYC